MSRVPEISFLPFSQRDTTVPSSGEVLLFPPKNTRAALASQVLHAGIEGCSHGEGEVSRILISSEPTLDDLLAAEILRRKEADPQDTRLHPGLEIFAQYAALGRDGFRADELPFARSLHGIFCALRSDCADLADPNTRDRFLSQWRRIADVIWRAADQKQDPFKEELFSGPEFARERALLASDREVYHSDLSRGVRLKGSIPEGPKSVPILILDHPKSRLFKFWSRSLSMERPDEYAVLLAVCWDRKNWVISTDPAQNISLKKLAQALTDAEKATAGPAVSWFDGERFNHSLIGSPDAGSALTYPQVIQIIKKWANATEPKGHDKKWGAALIGAVAASLLLVLGLGIFWHFSKDGPKSPKDLVILRGKKMDSSKKEIIVQKYKEFESFAILVCVSESQGSDFAELPATCKDVGRFLKLLVEKYDYPIQNIEILADNRRAVEDEAQIPALSGRKMLDPTYSNFAETVTSLSELVDAQKGKKSRFIFYFAGHGDVPKQDFGYLIFSGWNAKNPDATGFEMGALDRFLKKRLNVSHSLLIVDSCFSGATITQRSSTKASVSVFEKWGQAARVIMTASTDKQVASEYRGSSILMATLLEGLGPELLADLPDDQGQKDGIVTDEELSLFLKEQVVRKCPPEGEDSSEAAKACRSTQPQHIRMSDDVGQYLFIPKGVK